MTTVLLVDDEAAFRTTLAKLLQRRGFQTLEADSVEAALAIMADSGTSVALVLTDVVLPRSSGLELADRVKELAPNVRILFMSGYPLRTLEREHNMSRDLMSAFIQKPFNSETLTARIREALGKSGEEEDRDSGRLTVPRD
jgi:DNA-binding NtrC family response regulator